MPCPGCFFPGKETRYPLYRRLGGPQAQSGQMQKILPPLGFHPQTIHPVESCYAHCAILKRVILRVLWFSIVIVILPVFHTHLFITDMLNKTLKNCISVLQFILTITKVCHFGELFQSGHITISCFPNLLILSISSTDSLF